jgi:integrase
MSAALRYLRGVPLETIEALVGHKSVQTIEIYIKKLIVAMCIARPNAGK